MSDLDKQTHVGAESFSPERHAIIVIGASAGGVEALRGMLPRLPRDIPAALFITVHFPPDAESLLPHILDRRSALRVKAAADAEPIRPGHVYVAPPDRHLLVGRRLMRVVRGPTENGNRPAIDPMFRSAAVSHGARVIGVVLTGNLDDGTAGLLEIKRRGGITVAQDPADAMFPSMPASALRDVKLDEVVPLAAMAETLDRLAREPVTSTRESAAMDDANKETEYSAFDLDAIEEPREHPGEPSTFSCPDCGGVLWRIRDGDLERYRCRVGHGWSSDGLASQQEVGLETALWTALRALEESANLSEDLARRIAARGHPRLREQFEAKASTARERAALVRRLLLEGPLPVVQREGVKGGQEVEREVPRGTEGAAEPHGGAPARETSHGETRTASNGR